jgi:succinoglycan biosynthesis transport protein ExoP
MRRWWLVIAIGLIVSAATYVYFDRQPPTYTAATSVVIEGSSLRSALGEPVATGDPDRNARNESILLTSREVAAEAARELGFEGDPRALLGSISAAPVADADFLQISATTGDPVQAADLANAFAHAYVTVRGENDEATIRAAIASLQNQRDLLAPTLGNRGQRAQLGARIERLSVLALIPPNDVRQFEAAEPPGQPNGATPTRNAIFGLIIGLLLGVGAAYALGALERRIRWSGDVESIYRQPVLAQLPHARMPPNGRSGFSASQELTESFRTLRTNLQLSGLTEAGDRNPPRTILVTSAVGGEGKSMVVRNLAAAYSEAGARVVVVDADLRKPDLTGSALPDGERTPGLAEVVSGAISLKDALGVIELDGNGNGNGNGAAARRATPGDPSSGFIGAPDDGPAGRRIAVLGSGRTPSDPAAALGSERVRDVLDALARTHDIVLVDSSPLLPVSDALPLLSVVDGVLITTRLGVTTRSAAEQLTEMVDRVPGAELLGVVANDVRVSEGLQTYGYYGSERRARRLRPWR